MGDWGENRRDGTREFRVIRKKGELISVETKKENSLPLIPTTHLVQKHSKPQYIVVQPISFPYILHKGHAEKRSK